jgi:hypothetical protein
MQVPASVCQERFAAKTLVGEFLISSSEIPARMRIMKTNAK